MAPEDGEAGRRPAGATATSYLREQHEALLATDPAVRRGEEDAVHRMRVATRRARSALASFRRELDPEATAPLGAELKWLAAALGAERDREVLTERLTRRIGELQAAAPQSATADLRTRLLPPCAGSATAPPELDTPRYRALLDAFAALLDAPPYLPGADAPATAAAEATVRRDHKRLRRRVTAALALEPGHERDLALHDARKAAKRARYSGEAARPVLGKRAAAHTARIKAVQELLGEHQDSVMCRAALAAHRARAVEAGEDPAPYDALDRREREIAADLERDLPGVWHTAERGL